jgi:hypothetical protein
MDDLSALPAEGFDVVIHPVSTCYLPDVVAVYREVARVTVPGGLYISQHKQPGSLQASAKPSPDGYAVCVPYYHQGPLPRVECSPHREAETWEFLHRLEDLLGGMCQAGFVLEDVREPCHGRPEAERGTFGHRSLYLAPYVRIKARRTAQHQSRQAGKPAVWLP